LVEEMIDTTPRVARKPSLGAFAARHPRLVLGGAVLVLLSIVSFGAPLFTATDPVAMYPEIQLKPPGPGRPFGGDAVGRDLFSRTLYGGRISIVVGISVAAITTVLGLLIGLLSGSIRRLDVPIMGIMDALMAIPSMLLAIALVMFSGASVGNVITAAVVTQTPRVSRVVRSMVLSVREWPFVEAAVATGCTLPRVMFRHVLPSTLAPLAVQATYNCGTAILTEAFLSFLGSGIPPETPSWGNITAEGRHTFLVAPWVILIPGCFVSVAILAFNMFGDNLRDLLDPQRARAG
jgi:peptide/nickel transport system permease protein